MSRKLCVVGVVLLFALLSLQAVAVTPETETIKCPKKVNVVANEVVTSLFENHAVFNARFEPEKARLVAAVSGKLTKINAAEGNLVSRDFLVFEIDDASVDQIAAQEQEVVNWKKILKRRRGWKVRSPKAEAQAERMIRQASEKIETLKAGIKDRQVTAPIPGRIENLAVEEGADVEAGSVLAVLVNENLMFARIPVSAADAELFSTGRELTLDGGFAVTVDAVEDGQVTLRVDNSDKRLKAGDAIQFKILRQQYPEAVVLSRNQIMNDDEGSFVYVVDGKTARRAALKLGAEEDGKVLVEAGLNAGDYVITNEVLSAKEGTLKPVLQCVNDGGRIRLLRKDPESGRFVKAGKIAAKTAEEPQVDEQETVAEPQKPVEPVVSEEAEVETIREGTPAAASFFSLGAGVGYASLRDDNFKDVYGGGLDLQFKLAYTLKEKVEFFLEASYWQKEGVVELINMDTKLVMAPLYIGAKYIFNSSGKIKPYLGIAWVVFNNKETHNFAPDAKFDTQHGIGFLGGLYYSVTPKLDLYGSVRYSHGKVTIEGFDEEADLGGIRLHLGLAYKFTR